jgi:hypothetical protein
MYSLIRMAAPAVGVLALTSLANAEWVEPAFNPPIGSHWLVDSQRDEEMTTQRGDHKITENLHQHAKAELIYEAKTADGYRIRYIRRGIEVTGTSQKAQSSALIAPVFANLEFVATTNQNGVPIHIENIDDIHRALHTMVERVSAGKGPEFAAAMQRILGGLLNPDAAAAVRMIEDMPLIATAQNTGLKQGEVRKSSYTEDTGGGPALENTRQLSILKISADTKTDTILMLDTVDPASIHRMLVDVVRKSAKPGEDTSESEAMMNKMDVSIVNRYEFDVIDGMGRAMRKTSTTKRKVNDYEALDIDRKQVTLTPAP